MKVNFDKIADALYFSLQEGKVEKTIEMNDRLIVDVNKDGNVIGIEVLDVTNQIQPRGLADFEKNVLNGIPGSIVNETPATA